MRLLLAPLLAASLALAACNSPPTLSDRATAAGWDSICLHWRRYGGQPHRTTCTDRVWFCNRDAGCDPVSGLRVVHLSPVGVIP